MIIPRWPGFVEEVRQPAWELCHSFFNSGSTMYLLKSERALREASCDFFISSRTRHLLKKNWWSFSKAVITSVLKAVMLADSLTELIYSENVKSIWLDVIMNPNYIIKKITRTKQNMKLIYLQDTKIRKIFFYWLSVHIFGKLIIAPPESSSRMTSASVV